MEIQRRFLSAFGLIPQHGLHESDPNAACSLLSPTDPFRRVLGRLRRITLGPRYGDYLLGAFLRGIAIIYDIFGGICETTDLGLDELLVSVRAATLILWFMLMLPHFTGHTQMAGNAIQAKNSTIRIF